MKSIYLKSIYLMSGFLSTLAFGASVFAQKEHSYLLLLFPTTCYIAMFWNDVARYMRIKK